MTSTAETGFARLESEGRLLNAILKGPTRRPGRFGFRGELALRFAPKIADEARPPDLSVDQVLAIGEAGAPTIPFLAAYLLSFEYLKPLAEVLGETLSPNGKYFAFCNNIDLLTKYRVRMGEAMFYVLPIDEASVWNEMLELLYLERGELKRMDTAAKHDAVADAALRFDEVFPEIGYEDGLRVMGPVRDPGENRPV
ncbi:MAG TPA: hypothetical protein VJY39_13325 [Acidisphaera sp.]|nr:hypothetical protein [Acidisphaera sp.]